MLELFTTILQAGFTAAVTWTADQLLGVKHICSRCGQETKDEIANRRANTLGCKNCHKEVTQLTNACEATVHADGTIGHVKVEMNDRWHLEVNPYDKGVIFTKRQAGKLFIPMEARFQHLLDRQFVCLYQLVAFHHGAVFHEEDTIYRATSDDLNWVNHCLSLPYTSVPTTDRDQRIFAVKVLVKSDRNDVLAEAVSLCKPWATC